MSFEQLKRDDIKNTHSFVLVYSVNKKFVKKVFVNWRHPFVEYLSSKNITEC